MSYEFYKVLHIIGLIMTFSGLSGSLVLALNKSTPTPAVRKFTAISHGVGLTIMVIAGFGLAARLSLLNPIPTWIWFKVGIWLIIGGLAALIKRKPQFAWGLYGLIIFFGGLAAYLAINKP